MKTLLQALAVLAGGGFLGFQALAAYDAITTAHPWLAVPLAVGVLVGFVAGLVTWASFGDAKARMEWITEDEGGDR